MQENADYAFLADMEKSILGRLESSASGNIDRLTLVNTELSCVEKYSNESFYDTALQEVAKKYIEGLNIQKDALDKEYEWEYQIEWQRGIVYRYGALKELYEGYGFLKDSEKFVGAYVSQYDEEKNLLTAYEDIEADLTEQFNSDKFKFNRISRNQLSGVLKNNTAHTYTTFFEMSFYDKNEILYETSTTYVENIKPGKGFEFIFYVEDLDRCESWSLHNFYDDVKY